MYVPLQNIRGANQDDQRPKELAMMDLPALQLSTMQNLLDLFYTFHPHPLPAVGHPVFVLKA
jgi:hypothetical protein